MKDLDVNVDRLKTYSTQWDFRYDRFKNDEVIPFSISDMDIKMPQFIIKALHDFIDKGVLGYSRWKHDEFYNSVINWYQTRYDTTINKEWLQYSPGVIHSIINLIKILDLNKILVFSPGYDGFYEKLTKNNLTTLEYDLEYNNLTYHINYDKLEILMSEAEVLLLCNPHNPTGIIFDEEELLKISLLAKKYNVFIISDEIHMDICFKATPITKVAQTIDYLDMVSIFTSASKSFNFPALTFSYGIIPNTKLCQAFEDKIRSEGLSSCNVLGLIATMQAYQNGSSWLLELNEYVKSNKEEAKTYLETNSKLKVYPSKATYLLWIDASAYQDCFKELLHDMHQNSLVGIMDGDVYHQQYCLRMNVGCSKEKMNEGLKRIIKSTNKFNE